MPDYSKAKIYKIVCNISGETYYGSTTQPLWKRMGHHRHKSNNANSKQIIQRGNYCLLYTSPSPRDGLLSRMPSSA